MRGHTRRGIRDYVVIAIVVCGHAALVVLFARLREQERTTAETLHRASLVFIDLPRTQPRLIVPEPAIDRTITIDVTPPSAPQSAAVMPHEPTAPATKADWRNEAARSARNAIRAQAMPQPRGFDERETPVPERKAKPFGWDPSPGRFGMAGGLPYMKLGKRCAIGLGFFGCAIGELPPPDGTLFDGMDDPDRERSSVPKPSP
jgi:hypothetical protein